MDRPIAFVIEDQANIGILYEDALRLVGYDVIALRDGLTALNKLETADAPNLIILDINLPRISGRDLYKHIRGREKFKNTAVIILTANSLMADKMATEIGKNDHLFVKPIGMKDLQELAKALRPGKDGIPDYMAETQPVPHLATEKSSQEKIEPVALTPSNELTKFSTQELKLETQEHQLILSPSDEAVESEVPKEEETKEVEKQTENAAKSQES